MPLRSSDEPRLFLAAVERWYGELLPRLRPYLIESGGPILMVQVENGKRREKNEGEKREQPRVALFLLPGDLQRRGPRHGRRRSPPSSPSSPSSSPSSSSTCSFAFAAAFSFAVLKKEKETRPRLFASHSPANPKK